MGVMLCIESGLGKVFSIASDKHQLGKCTVLKTKDFTNCRAWNLSEQNAFLPALTGSKLIGRPRTIMRQNLGFCMCIARSSPWGQIPVPYYESSKRSPQQVLCKGISALPLQGWNCQAIASLSLQMNSPSQYGTAVWEIQPWEKGWQKNTTNGDLIQ